MVNQENYITKLWNLEKIQDRIDFEKTESSFKNDFSILNLYLIKRDVKCPVCGNKMIVKGSRNQRIQTTLYNHSYGEIIFHRREFVCQVCNKTSIEKLDCIKSGKGVSFGIDFEILSYLKDYSYTYQKIAEIFHVSNTYVEKVFDKYVDIKRHEMPYCLSIDEIYARKLTKTKYCSILYNPLNDKIVDCLSSRRMNYLDEYFYHIDKKERDLVKYFTSDLNETYRSVHNKFFKNSIHAVDSFHVIKNLSDLFNRIRIRVMNRYESEKLYDNSNYWLLKKFYKLLFIDISEIENKEYEFRKFNMTLDKYQLVYFMLECDEELREAYNLMNEYKNFNYYYTFDEASEKLDELIDLFINAKSIEMRRFGSLLINWRIEIINSFIKLNGWRLSNGKLERTNRAIKLMFSNAYGYTNFIRARNRIMYSYNKDEPLSNMKKDFQNRKSFRRRG